MATSDPGGVAGGGAGSGADASAPGALLRRHFRLEDAGLFVWLVFVEPILLSGGSGNQIGGTDRDPVQGLLDLVGLLGLAACLGSRSVPGVVSGLIANGNFLYAVGPLFGAVAFAIEDTVTRLGLDGNVAVVPLVLAILVAVVARLRVPPLSTSLRRTLVTPFILVTSGFFGAFLSALSGMLDLRALSAAIGSPNDAGGALFTLGVGTVGMAIFYVMLVFAPRQAAEREGTPLTWTLRFLLFLVSVIIGATWTGLRQAG